MLAPMKARKTGSYMTTIKTGPRAGQKVKMTVYTIYSATEDQLELFELVQGDNFKVNDDGYPILISVDYEGDWVTIEPGKKTNKNGDLEDTYRAVPSEDFELKRQILTQRVAPEPAIVAFKPIRRKITDSIIGAGAPDDTAGANPDASNPDAVVTDPADTTNPVDIVTDPKDTVANPVDTTVDPKATVDPKNAKGNKQEKTALDPNF